MRSIPLRSVLFVLVGASACGGGDDGGGGGGDPVVETYPAGTAMGTPSLLSIGAEGGTLASLDGRLTVVVPAGAVAAATDFTIQPVTNSAPGGLGAAYLVTPEGPFAAAVEVRFTLSERDLEGSSMDVAGIGYHDADGHWRVFNAPIRDAEARTVSTTTTHLSEWSALGGFQLSPGSTQVATGGQVNLEVVFCAPVSDEDDLSSLLARCEPAGELGGVSGWAVNGAEGGGLADGVIRSTGDSSATYTAPPEAPTNNPVAVSCRLDAALARTTLVSNITVGDCDVDMYGQVSTGCKWVGTVTVTGSGMKNMPIDESDASHTRTGSDMASTMFQLNAEMETDELGTLHITSGDASFSYQRVLMSTTTTFPAGCGDLIVNLEESMASGSTAFSAGTYGGGLSLGDGTAAVSLNLPSVPITGTDRYYEDTGSTVGGSGCSDPPPSDNTFPTSDTIGAGSVFEMPPFDRQNPRIEGSSSSMGSYLQSPLNITITWTFTLQQ